MAISSFSKETQEVLDYSFDWSQYLDGASISTSSWQLPSGLTEVDRVATSSRATIYIGGGTDSESYIVANTITTDESTPKTVTRRFVLNIQVP
jgi:hypothetical protein